MNIRQHRYVLWLIYLAGVVLFQEVIFRICYPLPEIKNFNRTDFIPLPDDIKKVPEIRYGKRIFYSAPDTNVGFVHNLNGYGFRDQEWRIKKELGKKRWMFIGDSFLEGAMAGEGANITETLTKNVPPEVEIMNLGVTGAGLPEYTQLINQAVPIFKPDLLVVLLFSNDISNRHVSRPKPFVEPIYYDRHTPRLLELVKMLSVGQPLPFRWQKAESFVPAVPDPLNLWTHQGDKFREHVTPEIAEFMRQGRYNIFRINYVLADEKNLKTEVNMSPWLTWLKGLLEAHNTELMICYLPGRSQVTNYYYQFEKASCVKLCPDTLDLTHSNYQIHARALHEDCVALKIPFLDLTSEVKASEQRGVRLFWDYDDHMRPVGYQMIGEAIHRWMAGKIPR